MRRTPLKRKTPLKQRTALKRTGFKRRARKQKPWHNKKMLDACRGQPCFLNIPGVCLGSAGRDTVVPCHANWPEYGKGAGRKADDVYTVPGCHSCHSWLDQGSAPRDVKKSAWESAYKKWQSRRKIDSE